MKKVEGMKRNMMMYFNVSLISGKYSATSWFLNKINSDINLNSVN